MLQRSSAGWFISHIRRPSFWLLVILFILITVPYYSETLQPPFWRDITSDLGLDRHAYERILYLLPIIWAGFLFGRKGAFITSVCALASMLPRAVIISESTGDAIFESSAVFLVGNLAGFALESMHKERRRRTQLAALNKTALVISRSLELGPILDSSINSIIDVMKVDAVQVFLLNEDAGELTLAAYKGISQQFVEGVDRLKLGEGLNGEVAQKGMPAYVENASTDPRLTRMVLREENIQSMLIVPIKSKEKVLGTISVGMRSYRQFREDEVELLIGIANQMGVAVENARLYEQQREFNQKLLASEERYRQLFENAHDAIWLNDLQQNIIAANDSCVRLTGYSLDELRRLKSRDLLTEESRTDVATSEDMLHQSKAIGQLLEVKLVKKDKSEAYVQLSTSPLFSGEQLVAFQHIARDITEEKRMRDAQEYYLRQVTMAQEEERKRVARELHDDTIQELIVLSRELDELASKADGLTEDEQQQLDRLWQQTNNIIAGVRRMSQDLRPATLDRLGLLPSLDWLASNIREHTGIVVEVTSSGNQRRVAPEIELVLFRIIQEALSNVWRHSNATNAEVSVEFKDSGTRITVVDNGKGFHVPIGVRGLTKDGKLGLAGMHERAKLLDGIVVVESEPGKGTSVIIEAPV